jgi:hypothetical protein
VRSASSLPISISFSAELSAACPLRRTSNRTSDSSASSAATALARATASPSISASLALAPSASAAISASSLRSAVSRFEAARRVACIAPLAACSFASHSLAAAIAACCSADAAPAFCCSPLARHLPIATAPLRNPAWRSARQSASCLPSPDSCRRRDTPHHARRPRRSDRRRWFRCTRAAAADWARRRDAAALQSANATPSVTGDQTLPGLVVAGEEQAHGMPDRAPRAASRPGAGAGGKRRRQRLKTRSAAD